MSQENVEIVRNFYAMLDQGDAQVWDVVAPDFSYSISLGGS